MIMMKNKRGRDISNEQTAENLKRGQHNIKRQIKTFIRMPEIHLNNPHKLEIKIYSLYDSA
jgi:hypothetical protein